MDKYENIERLLNERANSSDFSGVVLIKQDGKTVLSEAYGYANRSFLVKNTVDTRFRIASITKMFTAVAILQLIENKKISLETKVKDYLDLNNSAIPHGVTIFHLLTHTSGIADYFDEASGNDAWEKLWQEQPIYCVRKLTDYLPLFISKEPTSIVSEKFHYNGAGYILLGLVIEKASRLTYFDYVRENIFSKANMKNSDFLDLDKVYPLVAEGYEAIIDNNNEICGWKKNIYSTTPEAASDGGSTSTALDLCNFLEALRENSLLSSEMTNMFFTPQVLDQAANGVRGYTWKYGFANQFLLDKNKNIFRGGHTGEEYGISCRLYYYPSLKVDVIILGNQGFCAGSLAWQIHDILIE